MLTDATHFSPTRKRGHVAVQYGHQRQGYWVLRLREQHCRRQCAFVSNPVSHPVCIEDSVSVPFAFTVLISPFFSMYSGALAAWPLDCRHTICVAGRICCRCACTHVASAQVTNPRYARARAPSGRPHTPMECPAPGESRLTRGSTCGCNFIRFRLVTRWCVCVLVYWGCASWLARTSVRL
jgi:hypothetical protein